MSKNAWITPPTIPVTDYVCRRLIIPNDPVLVAAVNGALLLLIDPANWEQISGTVPAEDAAAAMQEMYFTYLRENAFCMIGAIVPIATATVPNGTLLCDGSLHSRADYPRLYDALHPSLIIDGVTFRTPDLRDRFVLAAGNAVPHDTGGAANVALTVAQLPAHSHTTDPHSHTTDPHSHPTLPHTHDTIPHAHVTVPHTHTDAGHVHAEGNTIPVLNEISAGVPVPAAVPSVGVTAPGFAVILPSVVDVLPETVGVLPEVVDVDAATVQINDETVTVNDTGSGEEHENMPPYYALTYVIIAR